MVQKHDTTYYAPHTQPENLTTSLLPLVLGMMATSALATLPSVKSLPYIQTGASIARTVFAACCFFTMVKLRCDRDNEPLTYLDASPEVIYEGRMQANQQAQEQKAKQ